MKKLGMLAWVIVLGSGLVSPEGWSGNRPKREDRKGVRQVASDEGGEIAIDDTPAAEDSKGCPEGRSGDRCVCETVNGMTFDQEECQKSSWHASCLRGSDCELSNTEQCKDPVCTCKGVKYKYPSEYPPLAMGETKRAPANCPPIKSKRQQKKKK